MQTYLDSYIQLLPPSQRSEILTYILKNTDYRIMADRAPADTIDDISTELLLQTDKLDSNLHNMFFASVYKDLAMLFAAQDNIEKDAFGFSQLMLSNYNALMNEIGKLRERVKSLKLMAFKSPSHIQITDQFNSYEHMDTDPGLYLDRNGKPISMAVMQASEEAYELSLAYEATSETFAPKIESALGGYLNGNADSFTISSYNEAQAEYEDIKGGAIAVISFNGCLCNHIYIPLNLQKPVHVPYIMINDKRIEYNKDVLYAISLNITPTYIDKLTIIMQNKNYEIGYF